MKKRVGFVSNSSSSSFVAVGFNLAGEGKPKLTRERLIEMLEVDIDTEWKNHIIDLQARADDVNVSWINQERVDITIKDGYENWLEDFTYEYFSGDGVRVFNSEEDGVGEDDFVVGQMVAEVSDDYMETSSFSFSDLESKFAKIKEIRDKFAPEEEMMVYTGTRMC